MKMWSLYEYRLLRDPDFNELDTSMETLFPRQFDEMFLLAKNDVELLNIVCKICVQGMAIF